MSDDATRARRILRDIDPGTWEHPADRAALMAVRRIPSSTRSSRRCSDSSARSPSGWRSRRTPCASGRASSPRSTSTTSRCARRWTSGPAELFVSQTPLVNAGAYGMDRPFIVLNSGAVRLLGRDELTYLMGHELGHVLSGHVLYRTMIVLLMQLATMGFPVVGLAARVVLMGLLEWQRKSELSADRAGLLALQQPEATLSTMMKLAGGGRDEETDLNEFLRAGRPVPRRRRRRRHGLQGAQPHGRDAPVPRAPRRRAPRLDRGRRVRPRAAWRIPPPHRRSGAVQGRPRSRRHAPTARTRRTSRGSSRARSARRGTASPRASGGTSRGLRPGAACASAGPPATVRPPHHPAAGHRSAS
jgi:hypothetical protein